MFYRVHLHLQQNTIKMENTVVTQPFVLTRYLYVKDDVLTSLCMSILDKDAEQAAFWTCELYYSGFETEVVEYLCMIYQQFFKSNNPRMESFIQRMRARMCEGPHIAVTISRNLAAKPRQFTVHDFAIRNANPEILQDAYKKETRILVHVSPDAMEKYKTRDMGTTRNWKFLEQVCLYETRKDMMNIFECNHLRLDPKYMCEMHRMDKHWVYCASFSPVWMKRIQEHNGVIDVVNKTVIFEDDDDLENFFESYGYEPDEQSVQIQRRLMHIIKYKQLTMGEFCRHYDAKAVKSVRKVKV